MNRQIESIHIPLVSWLPICGIFFLFLTVCAWWMLAGRSRSSKEVQTKERDWSFPVVDRFAGLTSPFHNWDPRLKIASLLIYWFCVASLTQAFWIGVALLISLGAVAAAKVPFRAATKRIASLTEFVGMFVIVMPFTVAAKPGDLILIPDPISFLQFNVRGLLIALEIGGKASAIALMMDPAFGTAPLSVTLEGLAGIGIPRKICEMLMLVHRYIFVFQNEAKRMMTGMKARGFSAGTNLETLATLGNFLGMLFVRSFERTEDVYEAMLARGYQGRFPGRPIMHSSTKDWLKGAFWATLGIGLLIVERMNAFVFLPWSIR